MHNSEGLTLLALLGLLFCAVIPPENARDHAVLILSGFFLVGIFDMVRDYLATRRVK